MKTIRKKMNNVKVSGLIILFLWSIGLFAQVTFNVKVVDPNGRPAEGVIVTFEDKHNKICPYGLTNNQGMFSFQVRQIPELVFVYDSRQRPLYGATCLLINQSRSEYVIVIPFVPRNEREIASQINNIYERVRQYYGYYSTLDFIQRASVGIQATGMTGMGVPAIFSIHPLPKFEGGKAYLEVSGLLADFAFGIYFSLMNHIGTLTGNDVIFQYHGGAVGY